MVSKGDGPIILKGLSVERCGQCWRGRSGWGRSGGLEGLVHADLDGGQIVVAAAEGEAVGGKDGLALRKRLRISAGGMEIW